MGCLQSDAIGVKHLLEKKHIEREHWEGEYYRCYHEVKRLDEEGGKNLKSIKELGELVQHLRETSAEITNGGSNPTQTLVAGQRELETKSAELVALKLTLGTVDADLLTEQNNQQGTRDTLLNTQNTLTTANNNLTAALLNTVVVNTQLVIVRQELDCVVVGDFSEMSCLTFSSKQLDDAVLHVRTFILWLSTKKLPARAAAVNGLVIDEERNTAEISYFASSLRDSAILWFNNLINNVDPAHPAGAIGNLTELCAAFQLHFLFDPAQKWRHLAEFFKTKQSEGEKSEEYIGEFRRWVLRQELMKSNS